MIYISNFLLPMLLVTSFRKNWGFTEFPHSQARTACCETPARADPQKEKEPSLNAPPEQQHFLLLGSTQFIRQTLAHLWSHSPGTRLPRCAWWWELLHRESRTPCQPRAGTSPGDMAGRAWSHQENIHQGGTDLGEGEHTLEMKECWRACTGPTAPRGNCSALPGQLEQGSRNGCWQQLELHTSNVHCDSLQG